MWQMETQTSTQLINLSWDAVVIANNKELILWYAYLNKPGESRKNAVSRSVNATLISLSLVRVIVWQSLTL